MHILESLQTGSSSSSSSSILALLQDQLPGALLDYLLYPSITVILCLLSVFVVLGNLLVVSAIWHENQLHSVTNYLIASLAAADCLVGAVVMPFSIISEIIIGSWTFGPTWCDLWHSFDVLASTASIMNLCAISLDRYLAITNPICYPTLMTPKRVALLIVSLWTCSSLISFPAIIWWRAVGPGPLQQLGVYLPPPPSPVPLARPAAAPSSSLTSTTPTPSGSTTTTVTIASTLAPSLQADDYLPEIGYQSTGVPPASSSWSPTEDQDELAHMYRCVFTDDTYYLLFSSFVSFYGPLCVMLYAYYRIYKAAVKQTRFLKYGSKHLDNNTDGPDLYLRAHRGGGVSSNNASSATSNYMAGGTSPSSGVLRANGKAAIVVTNSNSIVSRGAPSHEGSSSLSSTEAKSAATTAGGALEALARDQQHVQQQQQQQQSNQNGQLPVEKSPTTTTEKSPTAAAGKGQILYYDSDKLIQGIVDLTTMHYIDCTSTSTPSSSITTPSQPHLQQHPQPHQPTATVTVTASSTSAATCTTATAPASAGQDQVKLDMLEQVQQRRPSQPSQPSQAGQKEQREQNQQQQQQHDPMLMTIPARQQQRSVGKKLAKERKAAKTLGIVVGVFILCWLPFFVVNILVALCGTSCIYKPQLLFSIVTWLGWLNSAMNPVIYACWSRDFRRAFRKVLCTWVEFLCYDGSRLAKKLRLKAEPLNTHSDQVHLNRTASTFRGCTANNNNNNNNSNYYNNNCTSVGGGVSVEVSNNYGYGGGSSGGGGATCTRPAAGTNNVNKNLLSD